jgi:glycosyltransferase involved in cell wall biosynthesis
VFGRLAARGHDISLLVSGWPGAAGRTSLDELDVHRAGSRHTFSIAAPRYFRQHLAPGRFDVIVEDLNKVPVFTPWWSRTPVVLLVHHLFGRTAFQEAGLPVAAMTWLLERPLASVYGGLPVQAVSESTADDLVRRGFPRGSITVIENGVDLDFYSPDPAVPRFETPTVLYLGRLKRYKRVDIIIQAAARLREDGVALRLVIGGRGDHRPELERLAAELGITDVVDFVGFVSEQDKRMYFRRSWVHALTSPKEGWGISNMEAAACGTATVASDSPGLRDSVRHGRTGWLVGHGDIGALAHRLRSILEDPALRDRLGAGARTFAEEYSWERSAGRTEAHLEAVLASA